MLFNEFGDKNKKVILCMHGMCQDWHGEYRMVKPLEKEFRLIIPAMDGFYDNCPNDFTNFADQARKIEEYIKENYRGNQQKKLILVVIYLQHLVTDLDKELIQKM